MVIRAEAQRAEALQDGLSPPGSQWRFDVYCLDLDNAQLWRGACTVASHSLALALFFAVWTHWLGGEFVPMQAHNTVLLALVNREGFPYWAAQAAAWRSWLLMVQDQPAEGIALFAEGVSARRARGVKAYPKFATVLMVNVYHRVGQAEMGLQLMAEAQADANMTQEGFHDVALLRLEGELLLQQTPPDASQAEDCLQQALALAQGQGA